MNNISLRVFRRLPGAAGFVRNLSSQTEKLSVGGLNNENEVITGYEAVPDRWEWVERILPKPLVPPPPVHAQYPTPSGWVPPKDNISGSYAVRRTRNHMFPVYVEVPTKEKGQRQYTKIRYIEGDIWAFQVDLKRYLEEQTAKRIHIQVLEYAMTAIVDGVYYKEVTNFLISKGF